MSEPPPDKRKTPKTATPKPATPEPGRPSGARRCPICGAPPTERYRPFCSARCADIDLNRWLKGAYTIDGGPAETDPGENQEN
ncbi:MAG: DNA gyrase inhibitor YacG [Hyphomicrobiales bacterium]|nr:DNA gyrase inhibitor YacG [Hyphomicrobiales bacterium]